eukprot:5553577-Amphidinium_carterae.1
MAMALGLCSYMIVQQTVRPWRAGVANFVDMCIGIGLVLLLLAIAVLTDFQKGGSAVRVAGVLAMLVVIVAPLTTVVIAWYKAWAASRYEHFICHHKAGAGAQARLMKMLLVSRHGKNVFIDSDDLVELDQLFDIVKTKVRVLVVYLSRGTLTRPWCVGEICTAFESRKRIVTVQTGSWDMPEESEIDQMPEFIEKTGCNLQEQGITEQLVAKSLRRIVSDEVPTIFMDNSHVGGAKFLMIAQQLTLFGNSDGKPQQEVSRSRSTVKASGGTTAAQMRAEPGCLVACADPSDDEAVAAVSILVIKALDQMVALDVPGVVNVTDHAQDTNDPTLLEEVLHATQASRAVLPQLWPSPNALPVTEAEGHLKSFFKLITVFLATMGSDQVLTVNAASVVSRVPKHYNPSKQKSLPSIVRAVVVAAEAGAGKRVSVREEPTEQFIELRLSTNKLMEDDIAMSYHWARHF